MTARAMQAIGQDACFVSPSLAGDPLDFLREAQVPCLPNRFLAIVANDRDGRHARKLAEKATGGVIEAWAEMAKAVRERLGREHGKERENAVLASWAGSWDRLWDQQIEGYFRVRTAICPPEARSAAALSPLLGKGWAGERAQAVDWGWVELVNRLLDVRKFDGHIPHAEAEGVVPQKCTLMATFEQMGPAGLADSRQYWDEFAKGINLDGIRVRSREALCAIALTRRFAWAAHLKKELDLDCERRGFPDTATIAAARWLEGSPELQRLARDGSRWSGQWLHWKTANEDKREEPDEEAVPKEVWQKIRRECASRRPPTYYAVLALDADRMHQWLQGERTGEDIGPEFLRRFSQGLVEFARDECPKIVTQHAGTLVYAGGDDTLALLPAAEAMSCAQGLRDAFRKRWDGDDAFRAALPHGHDPARVFPSLSAGLAVVHHKEDLRHALELVRRAEHAAKDWGGDAIGVKIARRSGEESGVLISWRFVRRAHDVFLEPFVAGASDRWLYSLRAEAETLGRPELTDVAEIEVRRRAARADEDKARVDPTAAVDLLRDYRLECELRGGDHGPLPAAYGSSPFSAFVILGQSMSFLARGRD